MDCIELLKSICWVAGQPTIGLLLITAKIALHFDHLAWHVTMYMYSRDFETYLGHHPVSTGLRCAPSTSVVHHQLALCTMGIYVH